MYAAKPNMKWWSTYFQLGDGHHWQRPWVGALVTCGKTPTIVTWSERVKIYCSIIVTQQSPRVQQSASKFRNLPLQAKDRSWANCAVALSVSGDLRSRLSLMGLAFIYPALPTCLVVEVQKSDFHLINMFCAVIMIIVKKCTMSSPDSLLLFCTA